ncbi:uncharacterized protein [Nicotiana tomentosiformis]|uniref:uncharacterized protein n=1 Tax=Nicotiana tomentosiformis TaxID=4098 RepID=UPI00388CE3CC
MRQISQALNSRPKGALPSDTVVNPKGGKNTGQAMVVIIRSGRGGNAPNSSGRQLVDDDQVMQEEEVLNNVVQPNEEVQIDIDDSVEDTQEKVNPSRENIIDILEPVVQKAKAPLPKSLPSYPQRLAKQKCENKFKKFIQMLKSLLINVPLVEALEQIPGYVNFLKDLVTKKRSMNFETIKVTHQVSAIVYSMAPKLEDPSAFPIPCTIGSAEFAKALYDLGASVNLMPYSVFNTLRIGKPRPTSMRLQMADRTMKKSLGMIEDVLVWVDKFILPTDFVILVCEVDYEMPAILGRPFLAIGKALCDVESGELTFQAILLKFDDDEMDGFMECVNTLQGIGSYNYAPRKLSLDLENRTPPPPTKPSIKEPPTLELKPLPPHLWYEYLGPCSTLPVILSSYLTNVQVDSILAMLQKRKKVIGWTLVDIVVIRPAFFMYRINLEDRAKLSIKHQRRFNEAMPEVVKKEIINWLDAEVIYHISDSSWTSPVQCVPKKGA